MFDNLRLPGPGEMFRWAEPLPSFAALYGVPPEIAEDLKSAERIEIVS
jgi:hypothetical protein